MMLYHLISLNAHILGLPRLKIKYSRISLFLPYVLMQGMVNVIYYRAGGLKLDIFLKDIIL